MLKPAVNNEYVSYNDYPATIMIPGIRKDDTGRQYPSLHRQCTGRTIS